MLDLGLAVAGPFGTQVLGELGARVIKVNTMTEKFWLSNHIAMCCNRDKESITLNLKDPEAIPVCTGWSSGPTSSSTTCATTPLSDSGVDYESLRQLNPKLIYCHTIGHEQGPREQDPGNDQTAAALAGTEWLDGGLDNGGRPIWSMHIARRYRQRLPFRPRDRPSSVRPRPYRRGTVRAYLDSLCAAAQCLDCVD